MGTCTTSWEKQKMGKQEIPHSRWHTNQIWNACQGERGKPDTYLCQVPRGNASPYDGNLLYWAKRLKQHPSVHNEKAKLLKIQQWLCPRCGLYFREGDLLEVDHSIPTALGGKDVRSNKWVYHRHCHDEKTAEDMARIAKHKAAGITHK